MAWVRSVDGNNVAIEEYNVGYDGAYHQRTIAKSSVSGFIHIKDLGSVYPIPGKTLSNAYVDFAPCDVVIRSAIGGKVLTIGSGSEGKNGANAQLWEGDAFDNSVFHVEWNAKAGGYRISLASSGKNLDAEGNAGATVTNVVQWDNYDGPNQHWLFQDASGGWVYIRNLNGYYLDVQNGWDSNYNGGNVRTWTPNEAEAQKWKIIPTDSAGSDDGKQPSPGNTSAGKTAIGSAAVTGVKSKTYTGKALTQSPTVKVGSATLKAGTDYELTHTSNVNAGTATMAITGKGNFTGTKAVKFKIK